MYNSRLGHTSFKVDLPDISKMRLINIMVQVGTPEMEVTFSVIVDCASISILPSHSSINAMDNSGVRIQLAHIGVFWSNTALRSPYCMSSFILLTWWLPPI